MRGDFGGVEIVAEDAFGGAGFFDFSDDGGGIRMQGLGKAALLTDVGRGLTLQGGQGRVQLEEFFLFAVDDLGQDVGDCD